MWHLFSRWFPLKTTKQGRIPYTNSNQKRHEPPIASRPPPVWVLWLEAWGTAPSPCWKAARREAACEARPTAGGSMGHFQRVGLRETLQENSLGWPLVCRSSCQTFSGVAQNGSLRPKLVAFPCCCPFKPTQRRVRQKRAIPLREMVAMVGTVALDSLCDQVFARG